MLRDMTAPAAPRRPDLLIVDDSAMMRTLVKRVIAGTGVPVGEIFEASNGREALAVLRQHVVDVVFTDLNMPVMTGTELLQEMLAHAGWSHIIRVVISSDEGQARRAQSLSLNVQRYVRKPFPPEVMRDVLSGIAEGAAR